MLNSSFNYLFEYLKKEEIIIDESEFEFQIQSHPDFPSLLAISDTLNFFDITSGAIRVEKTELDVLPNCFIALLSVVGDKPSLFYIEKRKENYFYKKENKLINISLQEIEERWEGIVLLVEKNETNKVIIRRKKNWFICSSFVIIFLLILFMSDEKLSAKLFFIFPIIGIVFSITALKDLLGAKSSLLNEFCNLTASTNCTTVVDSKKWKFFEIISFSDLSILFFGSQLISLFVFLISLNAEAFFLIQKILLFASVPVLLTSLYYQKNVEKKWCPICLVIILTIISELIYIVSLHEGEFKFLLYPLIIFGFIFFATALFWYFLKSIFLQLKKLKENQYKAMRFERNFQIFKNTLQSRDKVFLPATPLILGNKNALTILTIITNPFCGHCKKVHEILDKILDAEKLNIQIRIIIKADLENETDERMRLYSNLYNIYLEKGDYSFRESLKYWFNSKDISAWLKRFELSDINQMNINNIYENHFKWSVDNNYNYTPAIFINGYEYPKQFERENLIFYIKEIIEDDII